MRLQDVLTQLEALNQELASVQKQQVSIDKEAKLLAERYKNASGKMKDIVDLTLQTAKIHQQYQQSLVKTAEDWNRLTDETASFNAMLHNAAAHQIVDAQKLVRMYHDMIESRKRGELDLAADIQEMMTQEMDGRLKSGKAIFSSWKNLEQVKNTAAESQAITSRFHADFQAADGKLQALNKSGGKWLALAGQSKQVLSAVFAELTAIASITGFVSLMKTFYAINEELIEANSSLKTRLNLTKANFFVSLQIGASSAKVAAAQRALLATGQKQLATDRTRVKTIVMLNSALGISEDEAAQLALYSDLTGNNFEKVSDALAVIVNNTNLTSREAVKLATTMAIVQRTLGISSKNMPEIATSLGVMEGALKGMGGSEGMVGRLVERFSSLKGIGDSIMFGGGQGLLKPEDFNNVDKMSKMLQNTGQRLQQLTGGDPLRLAAFEPMLQRMGLTMTDARALMQMSQPEQFAKIAQQMKDANQIREKSNGLEQRYREQQMAAGKQWEQLKNQGSALVKTALVPLLEVTTQLLTGLNKVLTIFTKFTNWASTSTSVWATLTRDVGKAVTYISSIAVAGILVTSLYRAGASILSFGRLALGFGGEIGAVGTTFGAALLPITAFIAAVWGMIKIIQAGIELFKMHQAVKQEQASMDKLADQDRTLRAKYNIPSGVDPNWWLHHQNNVRYAAAKSATTVATTSSVPFQRQVMQPTSLPPSGIALRSKEAEAADRNFGTLTKEVKQLQTTVKTGAERQAKAVEKGTYMEVSIDRLHREAEALRMKPATTYGLETYVR